MVSPTAQSISAANLGSVCFQSAAYGIFFVLSFISLALLYIRHGHELGSRQSFSSKQSRWSILRSPLFITTVILFMLVTVQWMISVFRAFDAFIYYEGGQSPAEYWLDFTIWAEVVVNSLTVFAQIICDGMITYRTWVVWNRDYRVIILPCLGLLALTAGGIGLAYVESHVTSVFAQQAALWILIDTILTLCINVYGTGMIAFRIWSATRNMKHVGVPSTPRFQHVLSIFIESAALYTFWTLFFIITFSVRSILHYPGSNCWPQVSGIAYMLITVRIGLGWAHMGEFSPIASTGTMNIMATTSVGHAASQGAVPAPQSYPLRTIYFNQTVTHTDDQDVHFASPLREDKHMGGPFTVV